MEENLYEQQEALQTPDTTYSESQNAMLSPEAKPEPRIDEKTQATIDQLYGRAKRAEEKAKELESKLKSQPVAQAQGSQFDIEEVVDLRVSGYTKDEIDYIKTVARGSGKSLSEVVKDPRVVAGIQATRSEQRAEAATPAPISRAPISSSPKSWSQMSSDERKANFATVAAKFKK